MDGTGGRFGEWTMLSSERSGSKVKCRCSCGGVYMVNYYRLVKGQSTKCRPCAFEAMRRPRKSKSQQSFCVLYHNYKADAAKKGHDWDLDKATFRSLTGTKCRYCGIGPRQKTHAYSRGRRMAPYVHNGVDRVNNAKGYVPGNVVPCCYACNRAKSSMTVSEWRRWARRIARKVSEEGPKWGSVIRKQRGGP